MLPGERAGQLVVLEQFLERLTDLQGDDFLIQTELRARCAAHRR